MGSWYGVATDLGRHTDTSNCSFQKSVGTVLGVFNSSLDLTGSNRFTNNCVKFSDKKHTCTCLGGGIHISSSNLAISGYSIFRKILADFGGGLLANYSTLIFIGTITLRNNSVESKGGGVFVWHSAVNASGNSTLTSNSAQQVGGGIAGDYCNLSFTGTGCSHWSNTIAICISLEAFCSKTTLNSLATCLDHFVFAVEESMYTKVFWTSLETLHSKTTQLLLMVVVFMQ